MNAETMAVWRAFFIAVGVMMVIVGIECLLIESATFADENSRAVRVNNNFFQQLESYEVSSKGKTVEPPEWIPWSLLASGTIVILYALTLPARMGKGD